MKHRYDGSFHASSGHVGIGAAGSSNATQTSPYCSDALYGITFKLANMEGCVLDAIDDFFGPLSLETVAQVIAFARDGVVSDRSGSGDVCNSENIARRIGHCRVLCLHAAENGLADIATRSHLMQILEAAKLNGASVRLEGMGHQDSLIGKSAPSTYQAILAFLMQKEV